MNKYIGYWRRHKQYEYEQPTIGLIICREAGREEVIYALDGLEEKIFAVFRCNRAPVSAWRYPGLTGYTVDCLVYFMYPDTICYNFSLIDSC